MLDEPSYDLDIQTLTALEEYLVDTFDGCLVVVSHDNFFVNHVCEHLFIFEGDGIVRDFQGSYTDYMEYRKDMIISKREDAKKQATVIINNNNDIILDKIETIEAIQSIQSKTSKSTSILTYNEKKEYNKLEKEINKLQTQINDINNNIDSFDNKEGYSVLQEWTAKCEDLKQQLNIKEERWLELESKN